MKINEVKCERRVFRDVLFFTHKIKKQCRLALVKTSSYLYYIVINFLEK